MARASLETEVSRRTDILSLSLSSITHYLQRECLDYQVIAQHRGVSLNFHADTSWSLKADSGFFPVYKGKRMDEGLEIDALLPVYAKLVHHHEIALRAPKRDRASAKRMKKHVEKYTAKNRPFLRQEFTANVIDAMGKIIRIEPIEIPPDPDLPL